MERDETYYIEGLYEELPAEVYYDEDKAIERLNELYDMHNKALGRVLPTMYREVVVTRHEYWNLKTEEWEDG